MIPLVKVGLPPKEVLMPLLEESLYSGKPINEGEAVYSFESEFITKFSLPKTSMAMSSGTGALHLSLILSGVTVGDEVITTSLTAEPTNLAIEYVGAKPVFCEIDTRTGNLCHEAILNAITKKTKAVIVVHYAGYPADIIKIREVCKQHNIKLIEDCAHALGAKVNGASVGTFGDFSIFSFQAIKHFTTIDGGFFVCNSEEDYLRAKKLRWFGMSKGQSRTDLNIEEVGYKYNYQNVFATIGLAQLKYITERLNKHIANGLFFDSMFSNMEGVTCADVPSNSSASYWLYTLVFDNKETACYMEEYLTSNGISASKLHKLNHEHTVFKFNSNLDRTKTFYDRMLHIPCGWWVDESCRDKIVSAVQKGMENVRALQCTIK